MAARLARLAYPVGGKGCSYTIILGNITITITTHHCIIIPTFHIFVLVFDEWYLFYMVMAFFCVLCVIEMVLCTL